VKFVFRELVRRLISLRRLGPGEEAASTSQGYPSTRRSAEIAWQFEGEPLG
jgi:hypothetical protein